MVVAPLEEIDHPQRLVVVFEPANLGRRPASGSDDLIVDAAQDLVENRLAGVAEGGVTEVVTQCRRLDEILVETERAGDGARQLTDLEGVGEPGARMISHVRHEDLGLVLEPTKGPRVEDSVAITLEGEPDI